MSEVGYRRSDSGETYLCFQDEQTGLTSPAHQHNSVADKKPVILHGVGGVSDENHHPFEPAAMAARCQKLLQARHEL